MTGEQYRRFAEIRARMKAYCESLQEQHVWLADAQAALRKAAGYTDTLVETPIVYNTALDEITQDSEPVFIIVADNPGMQEQKACNRRYLVGQSGKLAVSWFRQHLAMDFRKVAIIINKTPVHTPKTAELRLLPRYSAGHERELAALMLETQQAMAQFAYEMVEAGPWWLWVSGIGELGPRGIFRPWAETLTQLCQSGSPDVQERILLFRHFSMNQFSIAYRQAGGLAAASPQDAMQLLLRIGAANRRLILGF